MRRGVCVSLKKKISAIGLAVAASAAVFAGLILPRAVAADQPEPAAASRTKTVREAAVAGIFYPQDPQQLSQAVDGLLAQAKAESVADLRALICPHAGYQFSGYTAACAFKMLASRPIRTVILLMPSHYLEFSGAFVTDRDVYRTPLGDVPVSAMARQLARVSPFVSKPECKGHYRTRPGSGHARDLGTLRRSRVAVSPESIEGFPARAGGLRRGRPGRGCLGAGGPAR